MRLMAMKPALMLFTLLLCVGGRLIARRDKACEFMFWIPPVCLI